MSPHIRKVSIAFLKFLSYVVCVASFKSINSSSLCIKKYDGDNFTPTPCKRVKGQNTSMEIGLIELTEPYTLNYKPFFKHCILQTILHVFSLFIFVWSKILCPKNWAIFYIFFVSFGLALGVTVSKILCCPFYKVIGN